LLGTAVLNIGGAVGTSTTFTITSLVNSQNTLRSQGEGNTLTNGTGGLGTGYDLDSTNNAYFGGGATYTGADAITNTFTVTVTPEPGSLALGAVAASALAVGAWRRRRIRATRNQPNDYRDESTSRS
jgi:hypothetical protein